MFWSSSTFLQDMVAAKMENVSCTGYVHDSCQCKPGQWELFLLALNAFSCQDRVETDWKLDIPIKNYDSGQIWLAQLQDLNALIQISDPPYLILIDVASASLPKISLSLFHFSQVVWVANVNLGSFCISH